MGDIIFEENQVGEQFFMVAKGKVQLDSKCSPKVQGKAWVDGAFFHTIAPGRAKLRGV